LVLVQTLWIFVEHCGKRLAAASFQSSYSEPLEALLAVFYPKPKRLETLVKNFIGFVDHES